MTCDKQIFLCCDFDIIVCPFVKIDGTKNLFVDHGVIRG